jgi:hypothetical protein
MSIPETLNPVELKPGKNEMYKQVEKNAAKERETLSAEVMKQELENLAGSIDNFEDKTPKNEQAQKQYDTRFGRLKIVFLTAFAKGVSSKGVVDNLREIAAKDGNPTSIGLSELESLGDDSVAELNLTPAGKAAVENFAKGEKLYGRLKKSPAVNEEDSAEVKKQKEVVVAQLTEEYLDSVAKNIQEAGNPPGSANSMVDIMQTVLNDTVGDGKLSLTKFEEIRTKYGNIFEKENSGKLTDFEELLREAREKENPEKFLIEKHAEMRTAAQNMQIEATKGNPLDLFTRKYGELKWVALFAAEKWIYATLGLNLVLNGTDTLKNPAFLGLAAAGAGIYAYNNPDILKPTDEALQNEKETLTEKIKGLPTENPEVANWLGLVSSENLKPEKPLRKLIEQKSREATYWIDSEEIRAALGLPKQKFNKIEGGIKNEKSKKLFELLIKCQKLELDPKDILEEDKETEDNSEE